MASSSTESNLATAKTILTTTASALGAVMVAGSIAQNVIPYEFQEYFFIRLRKFFNSFSSQLTVVIDESGGYIFNELYYSAEMYLGTKISTASTQRINVSKALNESILVRMERNEEVIDVFQGVKFKWSLVSTKVDTRKQQTGEYNPDPKTEVKSFEVSFHKKHKDMVIDTYFPYIIKQAELIYESKKTLKIFTVDNMYWTSVNLDHPATFDTLAMDNEVKEKILKDLDKFVSRKDYYRKVGKAWKRGYLLYGPPGTGKSSLIAAMANYLKFDIYDLELTELNVNSDLRKLLLATSNRSILVVEDVDCTIELENRSKGAKSKKQPSDGQEKKVTLSGLLNFIDGLWSSCGDERIIVFTTNHKEKLDHAMLRPGRMDVHVHMSYCTPCGFRIFANNYLGIKHHELFGDIEELIKTTQVTPAEVAERLMRGEGVENALGELMEFLRVKHKDNVEAKAKEVENDYEEDNSDEDEDDSDEER